MSDSLTTRLERQCILTAAITDEDYRQAYLRELAEWYAERVAEDATGVIDEHLADVQAEHRALLRRRQWLTDLCQTRQSFLLTKGDASLFRRLEADVRRIVDLLDVRVDEAVARSWRH